MAVDSTSIKFSASYGSMMVRTEPSNLKITDEQFKNALPVNFDRLELSDEESWKQLWGVETTETVQSDGTVTKSISGSASVIGRNARGTVAFNVSISFQSSSYQPGDLSNTIDLLAAAHEVQKNALRDCLSGPELLRQASQMEERYQARKEETASSFAKMVGEQLKDSGQPEKSDNIYRSIQAIFTSFEARYQKVTATSSRDSWMDADLLTATMNLRKIGMSIKAGGQKTDGLLTLRELEYTAIGLRGGLNIQA